MAQAPDRADVPAWHQALAYALTGSRFAALGRQAQPDLPELLADLERQLPGGWDRLRRYVAGRRAAGEPWPYAVPPDLRAGLGAARFLAVRSALVQTLGLTPAPAQPTVRARPLTAEERRLVDDAPPHH